MTARHQAALNASERVVLLLSLIGFLREQNGISVRELANRFDITVAEVRSLITFLGTAGVPGETLNYQHEDLFDIDWQALDALDEVWLTQVVAIDDAPRFAPAETAVLIAGLQALVPVLPEADATRAEALSRKLARVLDAPVSPLSLHSDPADARVPVLVEALREGRNVCFAYLDAAGTASEREVRPIKLTQDGDVWYLRAFCSTRKAERSFRIGHMSQLRLGRRSVAEAGDRPSMPEPTVGSTLECEIIARIPADRLSAFEGFKPRVLGEAGSGELRIAIDAWHGAVALQLMRIAPGRVVIEAPAQARASVHEWVSRALAAYDV